MVTVFDGKTKFELLLWGVKLVTAAVPLSANLGAVRVGGCANAESGARSRHRRG